jgi:hypothetical protein
MDASSLVDGLTYRGEMTAVRQEYSVFEARDHYFIISFSNSKPGAGNFNIVSKKALDYVYNRFVGERDVTAKFVVERARRTRHVPNALVALNILYVLVAIGFADYRLEGSHSEMHFSIKKARHGQRLHLTARAR